MLLSNLGIFWDIFAILICPICHSECRGPRSPHFPKIEWHVYRKKMLFLEQYAIEECSIASYIAYHKCSMQTRRKYRDAGDEFTLGMFDFRVGMVPKLPFHLAIQNNLELIWVTFAWQYPWDTVTHERSIDIKYWEKSDERHIKNRHQPKALHIAWIWI